MHVRLALIPSGFGLSHYSIAPRSFVIRYAEIGNNLLETKRSEQKKYHYIGSSPNFLISIYESITSITLEKVLLERLNENI